MPAISLSALRSRRFPVGVLSLAFIALGAVTLGMLAFRDRLDKGHVALIYLLVVLGASARGGRSVGLPVSVTAFLLFNWLFLAPYYTLVIADPLDWLVLLTFLLTSVVAAELLDRQRRQAEAARARAGELDRLATLGAETLDAARAEQALSAIGDVIRQTVGVDRCELFVWERDRGELRRIAVSDAEGAAEPTRADTTELLKYVASKAVRLTEREDGTVHVAEASMDEEPSVDQTGRAFAIALSARGETVGALRVSGRRAFALSSDQWRVLTALAYYAALAMYRLRLEHAEETTEALRRADRLKDALLASVSHDLRTPLTTIKGIAHEIVSEGHARAGVIEEEADRLSKLVDGLLEMSQLDAGAVSVNPEFNTVDDLVGAALQRAETVLRGHPIETRIADDEMIVGRFDFSHALRIVVNLLENAAKYSPPDAPITLTAERRNGRVELAVSDRGPGVPPSERERIFEPFYRLPGGRPDVRGAGLGLSIARRLALVQGGDVTATDRDGGGSVFVLSLPAVEPPPE
jgi:two-component system sensor histidine kinase KdpD